MKHIRYHLFFFVIIFSIVITLKPSDNILANEDYLISSYKEDITGDGLHEDIQLNGELLSDKSSYYRNIWLSITSLFSSEWKISLKGGYNPELYFIDLNHDQINDIFYASKQSDQEGIYHYNIYSLAQGTTKKLPLPKQEFIQGTYKPNFKVGLKFSPQERETKIDISHEKGKYIEHGIYNEDGELLKRARPIVTPFTSLEPILISESKGYGLKSVQYIEGVDDTHILGAVETLWYYQNNSWTIIQLKWIEMNS